MRTLQTGLWAQPDGPGLKSNLQGSKAEALIVQSTVTFLWLFSLASAVGFVRKRPRITGVLIVSRDPDGPGELCWHEVCPLTVRTQAVSETAFIQLSLACLLSQVCREYPDFRVFRMPFTHHSRVPSYISHLQRMTQGTPSLSSHGAGRCSPVLNQVPNNPLEHP